MLKIIHLEYQLLLKFDDLIVILFIIFLKYFLKSKNNYQPNFVVYHHQILVYPLKLFFYKIFISKFLLILKESVSYKK